MPKAREKDCWKMFRVSPDTNQHEEAKYSSGSASYFSRCNCSNSSRRRILFSTFSFSCLLLLLAYFKTKFPMSYFFSHFLLILSKYWENMKWSTVVFKFLKPRFKVTCRTVSNNSCSCQKCYFLCIWILNTKSAVKKQMCWVLDCKTLVGCVVYLFDRWLRDVCEGIFIDSDLVLQGLYSWRKSQVLIGRCSLSDGRRSRLNGDELLQSSDKDIGSYTFTYCYHTHPWWSHSAI